MSKEMVNAGGFYAIAVKGLGRPAGLVTGLIATLGYNFFVAGATGTIGFFTGAVVFPALFGFELNWYLCGVVLFAVVFLLARSGIHVSTIVLGVALVLETLILVAFALSVLVQTGFSIEAFTLALSPEILVGGSIWIGLCWSRPRSSVSRRPRSSARRRASRARPSLVPPTPPSSSSA